jgi:hypothetical protein
VDEDNACLDDDAASAEDVVAFDLMDGDRI